VTKQQELLWQACERLQGSMKVVDALARALGLPSNDEGMANVVLLIYEAQETLEDEAEKHGVVRDWEERPEREGQKKLLEN
jgi:hypothetical protein